MEKLNLHALGDGENSLLRHKHNGTVLKIAYSDLMVTPGNLLAPINTAEHYLLASHLGFNAIKGDVRITADGGLIMCHDAGFTFDENGRIILYDRARGTDIITMTYDQVMSMEYAEDFAGLGHYAKVCDFDTYVRICKEQGKIAFVTLRENAIEELVPRVLAVLKKYCMEEHCVINSFTYETLREVRKYSHSIPVSFVQPLKEILDRNAVDQMIALGNGVICMFSYNGKGPRPDLLDASEENLRYARENDVQIYMAILNSYRDYTYLVQKGIQGMQIARAIFPYNRSDIQFVIRLENGTAVFENLFNADTLRGEVSVENGLVKVWNIRRNGSNYGFDDGLPAFWLNKLPFSMGVSCATNPECSIIYRDNALVLSTGNADGTYYIHVSV